MYFFTKGDYMNKKFGFTLTETLVMMGVIAAIAVVTFSSLSDLTPDKEKMLVKKAYKETVEAVQTLLDDDDLYPRYYAYNLDKMYTHSFAVLTSDYVSGYTTIANTTISGDITTSETEKSDSTLESTKTHNDNLTSVGNNIFKNVSIPSGVTSYTKYNKFSYNFAKLFDSTITTSGSNNKICSFTTKDGIAWTVTDNFSSSTTSTVEVDVNGAKSGGNGYIFTVSADGTITPNNTAANILKTRGIK